MSKFSVTYSSIGVRGRFSWPSKRFKCFVREASTKTSTKTGEKGKVSKRILLNTKSCAVFINKKLHNRYKKKNKGKF